jgi:hypothetical protein
MYIDVHVHFFFPLEKSGHAHVSGFLAHNKRAHLHAKLGFQSTYSPYFVFHNPSRLVRAADKARGKVRIFCTFSTQGVQISHALEHAVRSKTQGKAAI